MKRIERKIFNILLIFVCIVIYAIAGWLTGDKFFFVKFCSFNMLLVIYSYISFQRTFVIFAPLNLFCLYYIFIVLVNFYYIYTDFDMTVYIDKHSLRLDYIQLFNLSSLYYLAGLICIILGYSLLKPPAAKPIKYEDKQTLNPYILNLVAMGMMALGVLNFFYNVLVLAGGNPLTYLSQISIRKYQFEDSGTTIGYIFYYMGTYLLTFSYLRDNKKLDLLFIGAILGGVILWISNGRISATLFYLLSFIALFYYKNLIGNKQFNNKKYIAFLFTVPLLGIVMYFFRVMSTLKENDLLDKAGLDVVPEFTNSIGYFLIDKGNLPNIVIFMKIIDAWKLDYGYLYGQSLVSWLLNILPSSIRPENYQPSAIIKDLWFADSPGGHLPPTGVAEMYINFGPLGPFLGMFLLGLLIKVFYNYVVKSRSFWNYLVLVQISFTFIMIYPKGEFDNLNLIYLFFAYFPFLIVKGLTRMLKVNVSRKVHS